ELLGIGLGHIDDPSTARKSSQVRSQPNRGQSRTYASLHVVTVVGTVLALAAAGIAAIPARDTGNYGAAK
ncbi:hypothetical protein, partial [Nocardia sp. NPDC051463]|uniref:hypothetical protein n=1 Tax=Nocardia sp. NPDC051463 TaxID=3154845 RepID=UPI003442C693